MVPLPQLVPEPLLAGTALSCVGVPPAASDGGTDGDGSGWATATGLPSTIHCTPSVPQQPAPSDRRT